MAGLEINRGDRPSAAPRWTDDGMPLHAVKGVRGARDNDKRRIDHDLFIATGEFRPLKDGEPFYMSGLTGDEAEHHVGWSHGSPDALSKAPVWIMRRIEKRDA